ncbi:hypothetical protein D3C71_1260020 [compost metagenome]
MKYSRFGRVSYSAMNCGVDTSSSTYSIHQTRNHHAVMQAASGLCPNHGDNTAGSAITIDSRQTSMRSPPNSTGHRPPAASTRSHIQNDRPRRDSVSITRTAMTNRSVRRRMRRPPKGGASPPVQMKGSCWMCRAKPCRLVVLK